MRQKGSSDLPKASRSWDWIPGRLASTSAFNLPTYFLIVFFFNIQFKIYRKIKKAQRVPKHSLSSFSCYRHLTLRWSTCYN